jgi:hypothetical protein
MMDGRIIVDGAGRELSFSFARSLVEWVVGRMCLDDAGISLERLCGMIYWRLM